MKLKTLAKNDDLISKIEKWSHELGFQEIGFSDIDLSKAEIKLKEWIERKFHGEMYYMEKHGKKRSRPNLLLPGTLSIISVRMNYLSVSNNINKNTLDHPTKGYISRYALGRDYHKVLRKRLKKLGMKISNEISSSGFRAFVDSAPVLEKPIAEKAGLGWIGKNTNLIDKHSGSFFFLGEIYTNILLPSDSSSKNHCGSCTACINVCPTGAIIEPYILDARKCISYLTIELKGTIPVQFRKQIGNRIYGCDDCQIFCPWNKFAKKTELRDFQSRFNFDSLDLVEAFLWSKDIWLKKTEGSAMRRIGYDQWLRNLAVALGNAEKNDRVIKALISRKKHNSEIVREHVEWALNQHNWSPS